MWSFQTNDRDTSMRVQATGAATAAQRCWKRRCARAGLCQLPDYYVLEHLRSGALVSLLDNQQPPDTAVWAISTATAPVAKVRQLVDFLSRGSASAANTQGLRL